MNYQDKLVGDVPLAADAPLWLTQLASALQTVDRVEYFKEIAAFNATVKAQGRMQAIAQARALVDQCDLEKEDVFGSSRKKAAAVYRDPVTGKTWAGRGRAPLWLGGKDRATFAA